MDSQRSEVGGGRAVGGARAAVAAAGSREAYDTTAGPVVLGIGGGLSVIAHRVMLRIGRLPDDERVLR